MRKHTCWAPANPANRLPKELIAIQAHIFLPPREKSESAVLTARRITYVPPYHYPLHSVNITLANC